MSDPKQLDPKILAQLSATLDATARALTRSKGTGKSNYPYYNEDSALTIKEIVLKVLRTAAPMMWPAVDVSSMTLLARWKQGASYLIHVLEPEFEPTLRKVRYTHLLRHGLKIEPVRSRNTDNVLPMVEWRPDFTTFVDTCKHMDKFERILPLSEEDIKWINEQLSGLEHLFISDIQPTGITLVRYDSKTR